MAEFNQILAWRKQREIAAAGVQQVGVIGTDLGGKDVGIKQTGDL